MTENKNYQDKNKKYKQQEQYQQQEQKQQYTTSTTSTTSTTTIHTEPGVFLEPLIKMQLDGLATIYIDVFGGRGIPHAIQQYMARLIRAGMEPAVIASAIHATAWARIPTPYYMRAILQRYIAEGIMTEDQLNHDMMEMNEKRYEQQGARDDLMYPQ